MRDTPTASSLPLRRFDQRQAKFGIGSVETRAVRSVVTPSSARTAPSAGSSDLISAPCAVAASSYVLPPAFTVVCHGCASIDSMASGLSSQIRTGPNSPIQIAGWRVRQKPSRFLSSALKLVRPTAFVRVTGTRCIAPKGTPVIGIMPPYSLPRPSVPTIGSTKPSPIPAHAAAAVLTTTANTQATPATSFIFIFSSPYAFMPIE